MVFKGSQSALNDLTIRVMVEKWGEFLFVLDLSVLMLLLTLEMEATSFSVWWSLSISVSGGLLVVQSVLQF